MFSLTDMKTEIKKIVKRIFLHKIYGFSSYLYAICVVLIACSYYRYLDALYFVDPVFDADALREYTILEKLTLRVVSRDGDGDMVKSDGLKKYVEKYSLCQSVHEIQVIWPFPEKPPPVLSSFTFAHTHSLVNFYTVDEKSIDSSLLLLDVNVDTDGLFLLDSSIDISCKDMKLLQSTWRSSQTVATGLVPRMHKIQRLGDNSVVTSYLDWPYVWWNGKFSLLLSTAIIVHKKQLKNAFIDNDWNRKFIVEHPQCGLIAPSFYFSFINDAAPILVDVSYSSSKFIPSKSYEITDVAVPPEFAGSDLALSLCLTAMAQHYNVNSIPYSNKKSVLAKSQLMW